MSDDRDSELEAYAKRRIGMVLRGKYRLDSVLGMGGMAVVYRATHRNQAEFAIKILHPELSMREDVKTRFLREGYAANSVKHPGAVLVVDDDVAEDGAAFLVMELLDGEGVENLWERMGSRLPAREASAIVVQLLDVLASAHAKGIVHRDIKPANLFLTRDGTVKVLDFGIARARDAAASSAHVTGTGILLGTPAYMPPEQAMAKASEIDGQTDVWACGATLFSLISGHLVHEVDNAAQLMIRAATSPARSLATVAPHVPPPIVQVVDHALAFEKAHRWPSAAAMREALEAACRASFGQDPSKASLASILGAPHIALAATALAFTPAPMPAPSYGAHPANAHPPHPPPPQAQGRASVGTGLAMTRESAGHGSMPPPRPLPISGGTTAQPVSSSSVPSLPGVRSSKRILMFAGVAAVLGLGGGIAAIRGVLASSTPSSVSSGAGVALPPPIVPTGSALEPVAPLETSTTPRPTASTGRPPVQPSSTGRQAVTLPTLPTLPTVPKPDAGTVSKPMASVVPPKPKPNCDPNYTFDSDGNKHFKPECF